MRGQLDRKWGLRAIAVSTVALAGCAGREVCLPDGHLPSATFVRDQLTSTAVTQGQAQPPSAKPGEAGPSPSQGPFDLPKGIFGANSDPLAPPSFNKDVAQADRLKAVQALYPQLDAVGETSVVKSVDAQAGLTLSALQEIATANSPVLVRATADAAQSYGQVIQVGLYPNPTIGYQSDQIQPRLTIPPGATSSGAGQQGGYINQLIKTAGKLSLAQKVSGFDYINALVAVRRAQVDVSTNVRSQFFAALVAQQSVEVNRALAQLADEVYRIQLKQVAAGEAAGYEPLQLYAQAELARNALIQAENSYQAAWKQLAAAVGQPQLPISPLVGRADAAAPMFDRPTLEAALLEQHTDVLTAKNSIAQAQVNLKLQKRVLIPDIESNTYHQYDNLAQTYQFGLQFGIQIPISDRNQGNIRSAESQISRSIANLSATQNDLTARLAEAFARYSANRAVAERYREKIVPSLTRAYRALVKRYQVEPEKIGFSDIVVAQQNLATALQAYLTALGAQWQAVVDVANISQLDELYPEANK